mmetsp:Transcript_4240/g.8054  ORF Transcript_4240/g.8054 Transcript_4240/m.8054 type:complete len:103 (-) Transcript_4240:7-315(-)
MVEAIESMKSHDLVKLLHSLSSLLSPEAMARLRRRRREEKYEMELQKVVVQNGPKPDAAEPGGGNQKVDSSPQFKRQWGDGNKGEGQELATSRGKGEDAQHF